MRVTVVGGGGFRVPLLHEALAGSAFGVDEMVLHDVDPGRLAVVAAVLGQQAAAAPRAPRVRTTTDLDTALAGADVVLSAVRVGGTAARVADERVALDAGVLGQETTGAGGVCYGLRTVPVAVHLAERVAAVAPAAWVVNLTNPAGLVTEAMARVLGDRVVGVCDSPAGLVRRVARALGVDPARAWPDYVGLNHLGWLRALLVDGEDVLPRLLADEERLRSVEEGRLFGPRLLRALGAVPNEYLLYYYAEDEVLAAMRGAPATRGALLHEQQTAFYAEAARHPERALAAWRRVRRAREASYLAEARGGQPREPTDVADGGYETVAVALVGALVTGTPTGLVLGVRNRGAVPGLDADAVVEVPCLVDGNGTHPVAAGPVDDHLRGLVHAVKAVERLTVEAALTRSRETAVQALALHPLVRSTAVAARLLDGYLAAVPALARVLGADDEGAPGRRG